MRITRILLAVALLGLAACGDDASADEATTTAPTATTAAAPATTSAPSTTTRATTTTTQADPDTEAIAQEALDRTLAYFAAVNEGSLEAMAEARGVTLDEAETRHWQFHTMLTAAGHTWDVESCEIASVFGTIVKVDCHMFNTDPVFVATAASEVIAPFTLIGGELRAEQWRPIGEGFEAPLGVFRDYLQLFTNEFAACDPFEQTDPYQSHLGIARVPECAEVLLAHQDAMVAWVEAGMPAE